jgi:hypothetical protein
MIYQWLSISKKLINYKMKIKWKISLQKYKFWKIVPLVNISEDHQSLNNQRISIMAIYQDKTQIQIILFWIML